MKYSGKKIPLTVFFFLLLSPLFARDVEITVEDVELSIPLEGAIVRSWDGKEYTCDVGGKVLLPAPDDRPVVVQAAYPGYETGRLVLALNNNSFNLGLRLSGIMESRELVVEASRPGASETKTGRSVAVSEKEIAQTGEIGIIEDVMTTIKLLPGVGYTGLFNAQPSIRGGDPGDMSASLDGFYISNPYHWGGGFSIFDPRMVQSAQLSHGVFSTRYGHTISGLLEITSKKPSPVETEFELGVNTSAANVNLSLPLFNKGGIMFMGRITYYDPVIWLAKQMANVIEELQVINSVRAAPYIRSAAITGNYRFYDDLEFHATGFWGSDGVGASYENSANMDGYISDSDMDFDWNNYKGFITAALSWNPRNNMLLKTSLGAGYEEMKLDGDISNIIHKFFSSTFSGYDTLNALGYIQDPYRFETKINFKENDKIINAQGRIDYDWEPGAGFLIAAGFQEMYSRWIVDGDYLMPSEMRLRSLDRAELELFLDPLVVDFLWNIPNLFISAKRPISTHVDNQMFTSSGYALTEYNSPNNRFGAELGLRLDHLYFLGNGFVLQSKPALSPRLNLDFNVFKNKWIIQSLNLSAGTGLFSSMSDVVVIADQRYGIGDKDLRPNRSLTSVVGAKLDFPEGISFNIEGYYKYIYDRTYVPVAAGLGEMTPEAYFDGEGRAWGIDVMLQKMQARYWDGWLSYSFNHTRYRDPHGINYGMSAAGGGVRGDAWYYPTYHRFHNLNLVLNIKPIPRINIYTRLGLASGVQISRVVGGIESYPVFDLDSFMIIEKFRRDSVRDENNRTTPALPLDVKFSIFGFNKSGKTQYELYVAVENALALLYVSQGNTSFNTYTGKEDTGSFSAAYDLPIPIPSFGFKISF